VEATDPMSLLNAFERTGGDEAAIMKRAVLLDARTGRAAALTPEG
jgi:hypothetical protein